MYKQKRRFGFTRLNTRQTLTEFSKSSNPNKYILCIIDSHVQRKIVIYSMGIYKLTRDCLQTTDSLDNANGDLFINTEYAKHEKIRLGEISSYLATLHLNKS